VSCSSWVPAQLTKVIQQTSHTSLVLATPLKSIAIFVEPQVGIALQKLLTQQPAPRPVTQDLLERVIEGFEISLLRVLIYAVEENIFKARLILEQGRAAHLKTLLDLDCRPSDAIQLALRCEAPLWIAQDVLDSSPSAEE
jgi:uncharacterized protein